MTAQKTRKPRCPAALKDEILVAIGDHRRRNGDKDWNLVRELYPTTVGAASGAAGARLFWRWVKQVREEAPAAEVARLRRTVEASGPEARGRIPVALGARVRRIDFHEQVSLSYSDLDRLWQQCFEREDDPDCVGRERFKRDSLTGDLAVKDTKLLERVVARRQALNNQAMDLMTWVWDIEKVEACYDEIILILKEEFVSADPVMFRRTMDRIKALNLELKARYDLDKRAAT